MFLVFAFPSYYPSGGGLDYVGKADTVDEGIAVAVDYIGHSGANSPEDRYISSPEYVHLFDLDTYTVTHAWYLTTVPHAGATPDPRFPPPIPRGNVTEAWYDDDTD